MFVSRKIDLSLGLTGLKNNNTGLHFVFRSHSFSRRRDISIVFLKHKSNLQFFFIQVFFSVKVLAVEIPSLLWYYFSERVSLAFQARVYIIYRGIFRSDQKSHKSLSRSFREFLKNISCRYFYQCEFCFLKVQFSQEKIHI